MIPQSTISNQDAATPPELMAFINEIFTPVFDATATTRKTSVYPRFAKKDGIAEPWPNKTFWNPPYKQIQVWANKAVCEWAKESSSIGVLPANLETRWAGYLLAQGADLLVLSPRVAFRGYGERSSPPHATMLAVLSPKSSGKILRVEWKMPT